MFPVIDKRETGICLRRLMDERELSVRDVQQFLGLGSVQSAYHWLNGQSMPTIDNLYALSELFQVPIDAMVCGNRAPIIDTPEQAQRRRIALYYRKIQELQAA